MTKCENLKSAGLEIEPCKKLATKLLVVAGGENCGMVLRFCDDHASPRITDRSCTLAGRATGEGEKR